MGLSAGIWLFLFFWISNEELLNGDIGITRVWKAGYLGNRNKIGSVVEAGNRKPFIVAPPHNGFLGYNTPSVNNCTCRYFENFVDHFSFTSDAKYSQRYFTYYFSPRPNQEPSVIFFYCGNEANVELYVNATGLMWENQKDFNALLVFAEHRYYGESWPVRESKETIKSANFNPLGKTVAESLKFLTHDQALADYANLVYALHTDSNIRRDVGIFSQERKPVIAFGGSYGGMLSAWFRAKYPNLIDGAISASAPVLSFQGIQIPEVDYNRYWRIVTEDASQIGGSNPACANYVRKSFQQLKEITQSKMGRESAAKIFKLCPASAKKLIGDAEGTLRTRLLLFLAMAWDTMAMGNYPYESSYLTGQRNILLPAFPIRVACDLMVKSSKKFISEGETFPLLRALELATALFTNASREEHCHELPDDDSFDGIWDFQWCTATLPQESYFSTTGVRDMFFPRTVTKVNISEHCKAKFGVVPRFKWVSTNFINAFDGYSAQVGFDKKFAASSIVFTNGGFDPWSFGGVFRNDSAADIYSLLIPDGAHHLDLFFSHPKDPLSVRTVRMFQLAKIREWINKGLHSPNEFFTYS